jgi:FG-GAP-like repeat
MKTPAAVVIVVLAVLALTGSASAGLVVGINDDAAKNESVSPWFYGAMEDEGLALNAISLRWDDLDPTDIPTASSVADAIAQAKSVGVSVELDLYPLHAQAFTDGRKCAPTTNPEGCGDTAEIQAFANWTAEVAQTFPTIHQFVVMNECNQPLFVNPQWTTASVNQSAAICGRALAAAYDAIHAVDPENFVWGVGLSPRGNDKPHAVSNSSTSPVKFLGDLGRWFRSFAAKTHRTAPLMDGLDFHPYPIPQSLPFDKGYADPDDASVVNLPRIYQAFYNAFKGTPQKTIGQQPGGGLPVSLNETGIQTGSAGKAGYSGSEISANGNGGVIGKYATDAYQASWYVQLLNYVVCDPNIQVLNIFHLIDESSLAGWQSGLFNADETPKASATAVANWLAKSDGSCKGKLLPWTPPPAAVAVGPGPGGGSVRVFSGATGKLQSVRKPFGATYANGLYIATGDLNGDGISDVLSGAGADSPPKVVLTNGKNGSTIASWLAFPRSYRGGVTVAIGDVNGDGNADVIVGTATGPAQVKVYSAAGVLSSSFRPFPAPYAGGVTVAAGDVNGDDKAEVVVGEANGGSQVKVVSATGVPVSSLQPFSASFTGGVTVAAGDVNGDGKADVIVGSGSGGSRVKIYNGASSAALGSFVPFAASFTGGVSVAAGDVNGDGKADVMVGAAGGGSQVKIFNGSSSTPLLSFLGEPASFAAGVHLGSG